jgi:hypothetical protein
MTKTRTLILVVFVVVGMAGLSLPNPAYATSCDAIVGQWTWFTKGIVKFNANGTMVHEPGNEGIWECTDAARGRVTLRWRIGGYVNQLELSPDGQGLSSTDPSQQFVTARRIGKGGTAQAGTRASPPDVTLTTQPDGARQLPKDLPELMYAATSRAREWHQDAIPVSIRFTERDAPNPTMRGPEVRISFFSPSAGTGLLVTVTANGMRTFAFNQSVNWGVLSLPPVFVDLPAAVRIARENGMKGPVGGADLRIWSPSGAPPVLAWMVGDKTVNGVTGEIINYDVTGYITSYNAQWEHAARGLRALLRYARGGSSSSNPTIGGDSTFPGPSSGSDVPYDDGSKAREEYERNAAEGRAYWRGTAEDYNRIKNGECTMSDASKFGC